jgi:predicted RNA-binding protein with PIN domain
VRWLVDGYNVIRRSPELRARESESLEAGRQALVRLLERVAGAGSDRFTVVFDGSGGGSSTGAGQGVGVAFSSARESADRLLARMAARGGAVVSNDHEVRRAAVRAGAVAVTTDAFLAWIEALARGLTPAAAGPDDLEKDEPDERPHGPRKGNPRRMSKKARAAARALGRLGRRSPG